jgi:hypothetical protein
MQRSVNLTLESVNSNLHSVFPVLLVHLQLQLQLQLQAVCLSQRATTFRRRPAGRSCRSGAA